MAIQLIPSTWKWNIEGFHFWETLLIMEHQRTAIGTSLLYSLHCTIWWSMNLFEIIMMVCFTLCDSVRYLRREREMLCRQMLKKLSPEERVTLYTKWGIALNSKRRRMQLAWHVWTSTVSTHVKESASIVAKLVRPLEQGQVLKEMFGLSFIPKQTNHRYFSWKHTKSSLTWAICSYMQIGSSRFAELPLHSLTLTNYRFLPSSSLLRCVCYCDSLTLKSPYSILLILLFLFGRTYLYLMALNKKNQCKLTNILFVSFEST